MSYTVFALKWRPQNFNEIVGQKHIVATLKSAIKNNRLAHAYLFAGPRGVGKTSTARILAKALNCQDGPTLNPCQRCGSCKEISQGRSLDVIEIDGASNRGIDEIRTLRENVKFAPTQGKFKVYVIDEVHMLTEPAFNALLKTLEEPPAFVKFIFATTHPDKIPPTILSRCQRFDFRRIPLMEIIAQLERIITQEKINVDQEVLFAVAKSSDGALRDAESVLDQLVSFSQENISLKDVVSLLGLVEQDALFEITDKIIHQDSHAALKLLNEVIDNGKDMNVFLTNLIEHFRNLMVAKITRADSKLIDLPEDICQRLLKQSQAFSLEEIFTAFNILVNTQEMSKRLESLRIPLEIALVKLSHHKKESTFNPSRSEDHSEIEQMPPKTESRPAMQVVKDERSEVSACDTAKTISLDEIKNIWQNIIDSLSKIKMSVATYLNEGSPIKLEKNVLAIAFPGDFLLHKESLETKENKALIEKTISELLKSNLKVNFILSQEISRKEVEDDSFLRSTLEAFKGRVIRKE